MFQAGHWHTVNIVPASPAHLYSLDLHYYVREDPREGPMLHLCLTGRTEQRQFTEEFELHRDTAFNFASKLKRVALKHGFPVNRSLVMADHAEFDQVYRDIRDKLGLVSGTPINLEHLEQDFAD